MFELTKQERQVILFLSTVALIGLGARFVLKRCGQIRVISNFYQVLEKPDINSADEELLKGVFGIGNALAKRIIHYRQQQGGFSDMEELLNIKGISEDKLNKLKDAFAVRK